MVIRTITFILRRFGRNKLSTSLHLVGLSLGITVCLLIGLFIRHELSFDRYHSKADRIYRINQVWIDFGKKEFHFSEYFHSIFLLVYDSRKNYIHLANHTLLEQDIFLLVQVAVYQIL